MGTFIFAIYGIKLSVSEMPVFCSFSGYYSSRRMGYERAGEDKIVASGPFGLGGLWLFGT